LHISAHAPFTHAAVPFESVGHDRHDVPHPVGSSSAAHRAEVPVPHRWVPLPHVKSHAVPSQLVPTAPVGRGQVVQLAPQELVLLFAAQMPLQLWVPDGQTPEQAAAASIQEPVQTFIVVGHAGWHAVPSQVTLPPVGAAQAVQDTGPQLPVLLSLTQVLPQR
jgi:hypothetical protein